MDCGAQKVMRFQNVYASSGLVLSSRLSIRLAYLRIGFSGSTEYGHGRGCLAGGLPLLSLCVPTHSEPPSGSRQCAAADGSRQQRRVHGDDGDVYGDVEDDDDDDDTSTTHRRRAAAGGSLHLRYDDGVDDDGDDIEEDDGQPSEYTEWQDYFGGDEYYDHSENEIW